MNLNLEEHLNSAG